MIRLFVALDLPGHVRDALAALEPDPALWRKVPPESLHVTLAFLGSRPEEDVETIRPLLESGPAPSLALARILALPPRRPRVLTVALDGELGPLQQQVSDALEAAGVYAPETRPFRAHVTIARLRPRTEPPRTTALELPAIRFHGAAVTLYASRLHPSGARYEALASAALTAT